MHEAFLYLIAFFNLVSVAHLGLYVVGANVYDIKQLRNKLSAGKSVAERKPNPLISIIVPAHNEALGIRRTLDSIRASTYKNLEIIVVDDGSTDGTAKIVRKYIRSLPGFKTKSYLARGGRKGELHRRYVHAQVDKVKIVLVEQENRGKGAAMNNAIANFAKGSLIMCLDADSMLAPGAVEHAVRHFDDKTVMGLAANVRVMGKDNWLTLVQRFEHMIGYRSKKFYTLSKTEFIIGGVASTYRKQLIKKVGLYDTDTQTEDIGLSLKLVASEGNREKRIIYAADVVAMTEGVQTYKALIKQRYRWKMGMLQNLLKYRGMFLNDDRKYTRRLTIYRLPMSVLSEFLLLAGPIMIGYIAYISITHHSLAILLGAYVTVTVYTLWTIWPDEHFSIRQKLRMSLYSLGMYVLFYSMDIVQLFAIVRCLKNYKTIIKRSSGHTTWTSPARAGAVITPTAA